MLFMRFYKKIIFQVICLIKGLTMNDLLNTKITTNKYIDTRTYNALTKCARIYTFKDLIVLDRKTLMAIPWLGRKSVNRIEEYLATLGLSLRKEEKHTTPTQAQKMRMAIKEAKEALDYIWNHWADCECAQELGLKAKHALEYIVYLTEEKSLSGDNHNSN